MRRQTTPTQPLTNANTTALENIKALAEKIECTLNYAERGTVGYAIIDTSANLSLEDDENLVSSIADLDDIISIRIL